MTTPQPVIYEQAQCAWCGGLCGPCGDDWVHTDASGCTERVTPVICRYCPMPAEPGCLACPACGPFHALSLDERDRYPTLATQADIV